MPIGCSAKREAFWEPLIKKVKLKLAKWKADSLNQAGRLTLVKSVLDSLPLYWMNLHQIPAAVVKKLECVRRNFLWGHMDPLSHKNRKLHLIAWEKVCRSKSQGGLGIVPIKVKNLALLGKWHFRWIKERNRSWNKWLRSKYKCDVTSRLQEESNFKSPSDSLRAIIRVANIPELREAIAHNNFQWSVSNVQSALFWEDSWEGNKPLKDCFRRLYSLSIFKSMSIASVLEQWSQGIPLEDHMFWTRPLRSWEVEEVIKLESIVKKISLGSDKDVLKWANNKSIYSTKLATELLWHSSPQIDWKFVWKLKVPQKIKLFLWKVHLGILPTKSLLASRGVISSDNVACSLCRMERETDVHLLLECELSRQVWNNISAWWFLNSLLPKEFSLKRLWDQSKKFSTKKARQVWKIVVRASLWILWLARNKENFNQVKTDVQSLVATIKQQAKEWCLAFNLIHESSVIWWNGNPMGVLTNSETMQFKELMSKAADLVGFVDGSFKSKNGLVKSGIGGVIYRKNGDCIFYFSGPSKVSNSFDAEWSALDFMVKSFASSVWNKRNLVIYSDCKKLICKYLDLASNIGRVQDELLISTGSHNNIMVKYILRDLNYEADYLVKKGADTNVSVSHWVMS